jgi:hypothetical protein
MLMFLLAFFKVRVSFDVLNFFIRNEIFKDFYLRMEYNFSDELRKLYEPIINNTKIIQTLPNLNITRRFYSQSPNWNSIKLGN